MALQQPSSTNSSIQRIACIGEVMLELSPRNNDTYQLGVAGDTYNTAVYLKRNLPDGEIGYVTALGDDAQSDKVASTLAQHSLNTELVERRENMSAGLYMISVTDEGERSFSYWRSASAARTLYSPPWDAAMNGLAEFDLIYLSGISLAILPQSVRDALYRFIDSYRNQGGLVAFDSNYRPRLWESADIARDNTMSMWRRCDIALPSVDDEQALFEEHDEQSVVERLRACGVEYGALKRGAMGPLGLSIDAPAISDTESVKVVDSTAAGDSFNGAFLAAHASGASLMDCALAGHTMAKEVIQHAGAIISDGN